MKCEQLDDFQDPHLEYIGIKIEEISIINIYIPPVSSCTTPGYSPPIDQIIPDGEGLILGDFNAHDPLWFSSLSDSRGEIVAEAIGNSNYGVLNNDKPTRMPTSGQPTSPDISLASLGLLPTTDWDTTVTFGSDHLPILLNISAAIEQHISEKRTFINFNKAKWQDFTKLTEEEFSKVNLPDNVYKGEAQFRKIVNKVYLLVE